ELMAVCDRLEAQLHERQTQHAMLARAALTRFAEAPTPANLELLFHESFDIAHADLRKSILTLAVQGKLVPQDSEDEPAEELIARIAAIRQGRKVKQYEMVSADEAPYEVPDSWLWIRLGDISLSSDSGWSPQCLPEARSGENWGVLKVSAVSWGKFQPEENKALPPGATPRPECEVKTGDFLLSRANTEELIGRSVVVEATPPCLMMSDKIVRFTFPDDIYKPFINLANIADHARAHYVKNASGTSSSMKNISREVMCNLPIPLPPLAEQRRIVAAVAELMSLVDALESQLATARENAATLLAAAVAELTNGAAPYCRPASTQRPKPDHQNVPTTG
ncbi:MAG: restriction endonuclease subunit S, partial [Proteobacteria bacterium]|nr:restriction endonuclease subunit S [Pseudomonadota bacterium]